MKRKNIKRVFLFCTVFSILLNIFSLPFYAANGSLSGTPFSRPYMPVCLDYPTSNQLPNGEGTFCVLYETGDEHYHYFFFDKAQQIAQDSTGTTDFDILGFFIGFTNNRADWTINIQSRSKITYIHQYKQEGQSGNYVVSRTTLGTFVDNSSYHIGYYQLQMTLPSSPYTGKYIVSNLPYCWMGWSGDALLSAGVFGSLNDFQIPYYLAGYPDTVKQALDSISDNSTLINQYYNSINNKLNSLSSDHIALYNQNDELLSEVSQLRSQLASQSSGYSEQLSSAQSEIESNANAAASNAASEIKNAGEDISDIDNDVSDVNGIVSKCSEWVSDLDVFADRIDEAESGVATALENGKTLVNGFLGVAPPIVIALLTFCLCWFVVRKVIGR